MAPLVRILRLINESGSRLFKLQNIVHPTWKSNNKPILLSFFFEFFFDASVTEAATESFLLKKILLKFSKDSQRTPVPLQPY